MVLRYRCLTTGQIVDITTLDEFRRAVYSEEATCFHPHVRCSLCKLTHYIVDLIEDTRFPAILDDPRGGRSQGEGLALPAC